MRDINFETLKLVAAILGNCSAISFGIALFEKDQGGFWLGLAFAAMAIITIRSGK